MGDLSIHPIYSMAYLYQYVYFAVWVLIQYSIFAQTFEHWEVLQLAPVSL